tara:strand:- start:490 stop:807 length:318 start_codon:yes stop_codon:yes gene_type:complete
MAITTPDRIDMTEALMLWTTILGYETKSIDTDKSYKILFMKDNEEKGFTKAVPGGMYTKYPTELWTWKEKHGCPYEYRDNLTKPKLTGIEKRFQEDMINDMDSQY